MKTRETIVVPIKVDEKSAQYLAFSDVAEMKIMLLMGVLSVVAKVFYDWWKENRSQEAKDKKEEAAQIRMLVNQHHGNEVRLKNIEATLNKLAESMPQRHELTEVVRREIEYLERVKRQ